MWIIPKCGADLLHLSFVFWLEWEGGLDWTVFDEERWEWVQFALRCVYMVGLGGGWLICSVCTL